MTGIMNTLGRLSNIDFVFAVWEGGLEVGTVIE
jgi:hypothetical protein